MKRSEALRYREFIENCAMTASDQEVSKFPQYTQEMAFSGKLIKAGTRINWNGVIKKAAVDVWDTQENSPDNVPTLWADVDYVDGVRKIPSTASGIFDVSAQFAEGEEGYSAIDGLVYISQVNGNVYTPQLVPGNWKVREA